MKTSKPRVVQAAAALLCGLAGSAAFAAVSVTQTSDSAALGSALGGAGLTILSSTVENGAGAQFGTFTGFSGSALNVGSGVVLSNGYASDVANVGDFIDSDMGVSGTSEFTAYATGKVTNFVASYDVAALKVTFSLPTASAVSFSFAFGSMEYPDYVNDYTDAFLTFLDGVGASNQIVFDSSANPVQVGTNFASSLITNDTSTAFTDPHGIVGVLSTTTGTLSAGTHTLLFEVGDVNDHALDSAVFLTNLHAVGEVDGGPVTTPVPEPGTWATMALGLAGLLAFARRQRAARP